MKRWTETIMDGYVLIENEGGATLGYSPDSGVKILEADGFAFKDMNQNGILDPYEDWRLPVEERLRDLVTRLSVEQIAGLMLFSSHQSVSRPDPSNAFAMRFAGTYGGKPFDPEKDDISDLTDQQRVFLEQDNVRHVLMTTVDSPEAAARWNNNMQAFVEGLNLGIPVCISTDPRHGAEANGEYLAGGDASISQWPSSLGLAATFDPELVENFGKIAAKEYRALGITTALSPQIDLATDPRWNRFNGTFGEGIRLATDLARAYCDGFQTSEDDAEISDGWGRDSVNAMIKHWPGGGSGEGGRDAHFAYGKYAVYPGGNFEKMQIPFTEGGLKLNGKTGSASAVMPYYTISYGQDKIYGENVGNSYNRWIIQNLLRDKFGFDGVICTDWGITHDNHAVDDFANASWGVEGLNENERHYKALMAGVDQFGGNNAKAPILAAYAMGVASHGEEWMRARFEKSAFRLLKNIMRVGMFENPYVSPEKTAQTVGCPAFVSAGYEAQLKSVVMLKNHGGVLPMKRAKVYVPNRWIAPVSFLPFVPAGDPYEAPALPRSILEKYFDPVDSPEEADFAIVFMDSPASKGYDAKRGGYLPITLQYRPYTADTARETSIAGGHHTGEDPNRSYRGRSNTASNEADLDIFLKTKEAMGDKPVIVSLNMANPTVMAEFEPLADAILVSFDVQSQAVLDIISGAAEPSGLMPCQTPADMLTVEAQFEDTGRDMRCHVDTDGNVYDYAYGMNWSGVIHDSRTEKYGAPD
ncbi:MAG: glycoside hydrolase family 3 C-terminal domain-containing protein [Oscillospiraceae bacterium]|nr:glycoside hydrolase family 3 C-terminal domain-containing protein [Oscillospiraceae bacterium]